MDIASKLKLLRNGVKRTDSQLKTIKKQVGRAAAKIGGIKERQREASGINSEIEEYMNNIKDYIRNSQSRKSLQTGIIRMIWYGTNGYPGISKLIEQHGKLNGYDEDDMDERKQELMSEIQETYDKTYKPYPWRPGSEEKMLADRERTIFPDND